MQPLVSVIVPVYNGERYLAEALESILAQSYRALDIIVVDDGSTDGSPAVYGRFGPPVRYVSGPNCGAGSARNHGVDLARGAFLAFLDQDDRWADDKLAYQMEALQADPALDMVLGHVQQFFSPDWDAPAWPELYCPAGPVPGCLPSALLIRRPAFQRVGGFGTGWRVGEWADWYVRARDLGLVCRVLPGLVAWRRIHSGNQGLAARGAGHEYARLLKASLDRRRGQAAPAGPSS